MSNINWGWVIGGLGLLVSVIFSFYSIVYARGKSEGIVNNHLHEVNGKLDAMFRRIDELDKVDGEQGRQMAAVLTEIGNMKEEIRRLRDRTNGIH